MMIVKAYAVSLCKDSQELFSTRVETTCYVVKGARDDVVAGRATLYRAIEIAMGRYGAHCLETKQEQQDVSSVIASYLGIAAPCVTVDS